MKEALAKKLENNFGLKVISVALAIFLWLLVINDENPFETKNLTISNIEYQNVETVLAHNQTYTVEELDDKGVDISVQVRRKDSGRVRASDFKAVVDLAQVGPYGYAEVQVRWLGSTQYELKEEDISWKTKSVKVTLENIIKLTYPVKMKVTGDPASSYIVGEYRPNPRSVEIMAPQSIHELIHSVGIEISVADLNSTVDGTAKLKFYGVTGEEVKLDRDSFESYEFSVSAEEIAYNVPLLKIKEVILRTNGYVGTVAEGYRYTGMEGANQTAYIAGFRTELAQVDAINIPAEALNLEGATENVPVQIDLSQYVPEGITVEGNKFVTITLMVEPLVKQTREILAGKIRIEDMQEGWEYKLEDGALVTLQGLQEDLNTLTNEMIDVWISVKDLKPGVNEVEVHAKVDDAFEILQTGKVKVLVEEILETEETTEETTAEETTEAETTAEETTAEETTEAAAVPESTEAEAA